MADRTSYVTGYSGTALDALTADLDLLCDIERDLRVIAEADGRPDLAQVHHIRLTALMLARTHVLRALPGIVEEARVGAMDMADLTLHAAGLLP